MEWYWCTDWDCVAAWVWSPATAAWAQAILTGIAILFSGWLGRKAFRDSVDLEHQKAHMAALEALARFEVLLGSAAAHLQQFLDDCQTDGGKVPQPYFRVVGNDLEKQEVAIRTVMMKTVPSVHIFRDMVAASNALQSVVTMLYEITDGIAHPRLDLPAEVLDDIKAYEEKLLIYRKAFGKDRNATWEGVHPGDTGFAHERQVQVRQ